MLSGFKQFIARGNVIDSGRGRHHRVRPSADRELSLVKDIITPIIGMAGGRPDFSSIHLGKDPASAASSTT